MILSLGYPKTRYVRITSLPYLRDICSADIRNQRILSARSDMIPVNGLMNIPTTSSEPDPAQRRPCLRIYHPFAARYKARQIRQAQHELSAFSHGLRSQPKSGNVLSANPLYALARGLRPTAASSLKCSPLKFLSGIEPPNP